MSKRSILGLLGILAWVGVAAGDASAFSVSYDQKTTHGRDVYQSTMSLKDDRFRMEMTVGGQTSIIIRNAEGTYTVMPSEGMAMKTPNLRAGQRPVRGAGNYAQYLQQQRAERTGSETIDGRACDIYRFSDPEAGGTTTVWVWKDKMFPIRFETETSDGKTLVELSNIQLGAAIPDEAFQLPAGVQVMDMGALMGMQ
jgi:outer membrane lipoprotein-sorting protein